MLQRLAVASVVLLFLSGCLGFGDEVEVEQEYQPEECNGMDILCDRTYDTVTFPETHNAFATHEDGIWYPASNHATGFQAQWDAGMRAFMLDTHYANLDERVEEGVRFCHGDDSRGFSPCVYGSVEPKEWLDALYEEMVEHSDDVVTLLIENYVEADHLRATLNSSIPEDWWFVHEYNTTWPTLGDMIRADTRLVIFWEQGANESHPWFHDFLEHSWTTNYAEDSTEDMNCEVLRGDVTRPVFHMNSWLSGALGLSDPNRADQANDVDFLVNRSIECYDLHGKYPTFIAVDWWEDGDVVEAARQVNLLER